MKYLDDLGENVQMLLDSAPSVSALLMKVPPRLRGSVTSIMDSMIPDAEEAETSRRPGSMILILLLRYYTLCIVMEREREREKVIEVLKMRGRYLFTCRRSALRMILFLFID